MICLEVEIYQYSVSMNWNVTWVYNQQAELREHDHVVECIAWCEGSACTSVNEAVATDNRKPNYKGPFLISGSRDKTIKVSLRE